MMRIIFNSKNIFIKRNGGMVKMKLLKKLGVMLLTTALAIPVNFNEPSIQPLDTQFKSENVVVISP